MNGVDDDMPPDWQEAKPVPLPPEPAPQPEPLTPEPPPPDLKRTRRVRQPAQQVDRLPPYSQECEQGSIGCILLSPNDCMPEAIERLRDNGEEFYDLRNKTIYECLLDMYEQRIAIDVITLQEQLKKKQLLEQVGGISYLASLPDAVPSAANIAYYLDFLVEKYMLRKAIWTCTDLVSEIYEFTGSADELMDRVESDIIRIRENRQIESAPDMRTLIQRSISKIEDYQQRQGAITGISCGFTYLDRMTSGLQPAEMVVIAARPSMGKTSLAMNIVESVAVDQNLPVGVFSLEMTAEALVLRMLCSRSRVNIRNVTDGFLAERDFPKITGAAGRLARAPIFIDDTGGLTIMQLRAKARRMVSRRGIKLIVIDYLQLLHGSKRNQSRQEEISDVARGIKNLAKELNIPIVVLCQLNREMEREKGRKPRMSDLRESGEIENAADFIGFLYRAISDDDSDEFYSEALPVNLLIGKQRNGPTGEVNLTFLKPYTRFESAARVSDDDVPQQSTML